MYKISFLHPVHQPFAYALHNFFRDGPSTHVYKPLDVWPKIRNGNKIRRPDMFELSILQENKWEVGQTLEATLLIPSKIPPLRHG
jgi:hypothetical protein